MQPANRIRRGILSPKCGEMMVEMNEGEHKVRPYDCIGAFRRLVPGDCRQCFLHPQRLFGHVAAGEQDELRAQDELD